MRQPAVQGEMSYKHESGVYFITRGSNVDGTTHYINNSSLEWDFFLGFTHALGRTAIVYDVGFEYYYYPGGSSFVPRQVSYNTIEYYVSFKYKGLEVRFTQTVTDYFAVNSQSPPMNWQKGRLDCPNGHSFGSPYGEINFEKEFFPKWTLTLHAGYQGVTNYPQLDYFDWLAGLAREFAWFTVSLSYVQAHAKSAYYTVPDHAYKPHKINLAGPTVVAEVSRKF